MRTTIPSRIRSAAVALIAITLTCGSISFAQYAETVLHTFNASTGGISVNRPLVSDGAGNLYGTTFDGGATGNGIFYELSPTASHGWQQSQLFSFPFATALNASTNPVGGMTRDSAGNFYGLSPYDGIENCIDSGGNQVGCGTIWKLSLTTKGWRRTILYSFVGGANGGGPFSLVMDSAGNLYGLTSAEGWGSVFELARNGGNWSFSTLYTFTGGADGGAPNAIVLDHTGNLLGSTYAGGIPNQNVCYDYNTNNFGCGVVFELSPSSGGTFTESTLYSFLGGNDGGQPYGPVALDASGNLFGVAGPFASPYPDGEIFELSRGSGGWTENVLYAFTSPMSPAGMTSDASGNLYGATLQGGLLNLCENGCGTIFAFSPVSGGWSYSTIYSFTGTFDGQYPQVPSIPEATGNLFIPTLGFLVAAQNSALGGEGIWFELSPAGGGKWQGSVVADLPTSNDGYDSTAPLIADPNDPDVFYGTTLWGGSRGWGTVFKLYPSGSGWKETILYNFLGEGDGALPAAGLARDAAGNLYGTTEYGGTLNCALGCGTVFKLSPLGASWKFSVVHSFKNGADGRYPREGVTVDAAGNVYGTTATGASPKCGFYGCGAVFELSPTTGGGWQTTILHEFQGQGDGGEPGLGTVVLDASGNLYGLTTVGGANGTGVVYELSPGSTWKETVLYNFLASEPFNECALILDSAGHVYGTTARGGTNNFGTVFELSRSGSIWTKTVLYSFTSSDGGFPVGGLVFDSAGNLFGLTQSKAYELSPVSGGWQETNLTAFNELATGSPQASLVVDANGDLFGTTSNFNGAQSPSIIFELTP